MKLYFYPGACSMAVHIALREAGYTFDIDKVDLKAKKTQSGEDYNQVNAKGYVPALRLDDGQVLTEDAVLLQYVVDHKPEAGLAPLPGTLERYRFLEWLNFIATEIHKTLGALFNPNITPEWKSSQLALFGRRMDYLMGKLGSQPYVMGDHFTVADGYLFTVLNWCNLMNVDTSAWPRLKEYMDRIASRPAVVAAMKAEGLI
ncbi:MAG: glutathione transferase GstA [Thiobacillaceae bacterium]